MTLFGAPGRGLELYHVGFWAEDRLAHSFC